MLALDLFAKNELTYFFLIILDVNGLSLLKTHIDKLLNDLLNLETDIGLESQLHLLFLFIFERLNFGKQSGPSGLVVTFVVLTFLPRKRKRKSLPRGL